MPVLRNYQQRSDLNIATEYMLQSLRDAQANARAGKNSGQWGVYVPKAQVFEGIGYDNRTSEDEPYPLPPSIDIAGLVEVPFIPVSGRPQTSGEIILTARSGDQRIITIGDQGTIAATGIASGDVWGGGQPGGGEDDGDSSASSAQSQTSSGMSSQGSTASSGASSEGTSSAQTSGGTSSDGQQGQGSSATSGSAQSGVSSAASTGTGENGGGSSAQSATASAPTTPCEDRFLV